MKKTTPDKKRGLQWGLMGHLKDLDFADKLALTAMVAFNSQQNIWKSKRLARKTKIKLFKSKVKSVFLYGAESWRTVVTEINQLKTLEGDFKKLKLTWGTVERETKKRHSWDKRSSCIILNG